MRRLERPDAAHGPEGYRRASRWRSCDEEGAVAVIVAITMVVLIGAVALTVDVGGLFAERRALQNSADAAALAVAIDCAGGNCDDYEATALDYALANNPGGANVEDITPDPLTPAAGEVTIDVRTGDDSGGIGTIRNWFAGVGDADNAEGIVRASATAVWGGSSMGAVPMAVSLCDFMGVDDDEFDLAAIDARVATLPAGEGFDPSAHGPPERIIVHEAGDDDKCTVSPGFAGSGEDKMPAGFGWLSTLGGTCELNITDYEESGEFWVPRVGGTFPGGNTCLKSVLDSGQAAPIPIFTGFAGPPTSKYRLYAPAGFYVTGYRIPGGSDGGTQGVLTAPCTGSTWCLEGYFVQLLVSGEVGEGVGNLGANAVRLSN